MKRKEGPGPLLAVVGATPELEGSAWKALDGILSGAKARNYAARSLDEGAPPWTPAALLLIGEDAASAWKAAPWLDPAPPTASILSLAGLVRAGHPTPTSKLKVQRATSAVRRLLKKATGQPTSTCAHPETIGVGRWEGGRKPSTIRVCASCCELSSD